MLHIGVTGGIGSGKSTFLRVWERLGVPVVYADDLARQLMVSDKGLKREITRVFGSQSYDRDGCLNRKYLADAAFRSARVGELNSIVHPVVYRELAKRKARAVKDGTELFAYESALLLTDDKGPGCDFVVLISCPLEKRIRRVMDRDDTVWERVRERIERQPDFTRLEKKADYVVCNDGTPHMLERKAEVLYDELLGRTTGHAGE